MTDLISKLSKIDQRNVKLAIIHANNGNYRAIDSMIRAANNKSAPVLTAIRAALQNIELTGGIGYSVTD